MKLISFNVNGLRAVHKKGALAKLFALSPDVLALQEIKCEVTQIPQDRFAPLGYSTYFLSAQNRKGYSGVAFYTKEKVIDAPIAIKLSLANQQKANELKKQGNTLQHNSVVKNT